MNRKEFLKKSALFGLAAPFLASLLTSCEKDEDIITDFTTNFNGKVLIIGAGAAGITAGYILNRYGVEFEILEASAIHGGRVKKADALADFPIDLGAEWVHTSPSVFSEILKDPGITGSVDMVPYSPETISIWNGSRMTPLNIGSNFYGEYKYKNSTWYDFFDQNMIPQIQDRIVYNSPVTDIDYTTDQVTVRTMGGTNYVADKVLVTVPLNILKEEFIAFRPALPLDKVEAMDGVNMNEGFKAFIKFSERFYPDMFAASFDKLNSDEHPQIFYDAAFRKGSDQHILGLFTVGDPAGVYSGLATDAEKIAYILGELDEMFDGQATANYVDHVLQDWTNEPYIRGSYSLYGANEEEVQATLTRPLDNKVFFAGELYSTVSYATVHGAALSSYDAIDLILQG